MGEGEGGGERDKDLLVPLPFIPSRLGEGKFLKVVYPMPDLNEIKKSDVPPVAERLVLNYVAPGSRLRLRGDVCQQVKDREWIFNKVKDQTIFLIHETGTYGIAVGIEDIDWTGF